jgi:murein DD-endopeptidase MepM/ murein hydrolase activator NlpD
VASTFQDEWDRLSYDPRTWPGMAEASGGAPARPVARTDRRRLAIAIGAGVAILSGGAVTAFLSRGGESTPVSTTSQNNADTAATPGPKLSRRTLVLSGPGDLKAALIANGIAPAAADAAATAAIGALDAGGEIRAVLTIATEDGSPRLQRLDASNPDSSGAVVSAGADGGFVASRVAARLSSKVIVRRGTMDADSFYSSAVAAGISDSLIPVFAKALAFDFDFQREVHLGDAFEAAFEQEVNASGEPVGAPTLLYASLTTASKSSSVYRFMPPGEREPQWFDSSGRSIVRALMRTPVDGARVSSKFGFRTHPILGYQKLHKGTDFAAPIGTPIYASGNGVVEWAAMKGANGNLTILRHENGWQTYYLHQNHFAAGIAPGVRVSQGQQIGEIGTTGRSTGPHLHYEVHVDGQPVDPLGIQTESGQTLSGQALIAFAKERDRIDVSRAGQAE